jgi:hypothetical protein
MENRDVRTTEPKCATSVWKLVAAIVVTAVVVGAGAYVWHRSAVKDLRRQSEPPRTEYASFTVYGADPHTWSATDDFAIAIPEELPLAERLQVLADALSRRRFGKLPIEIIGVEERDGKTIVLVNLLESDWNRDLFAEERRLWSEGKREEAKSLRRKSQKPTWRMLYFQGSTGGACTTIMLVDTFLQRGYDGTWLDGVEFHYEGEPISDEWDHIHLTGTKYRQTAQASEPSPQ